MNIEMGEQVVDDEVQPEPPFQFLCTSDHLCDIFGVSKSTIWRWRLVGYLPLPTLIAGIGYYWKGCDLEAWRAAGYPWARPNLRPTAIRHARANDYDLNEYIAPKGADEDTPVSVAAYEKLEEAVNQYSFWAAVDEPELLPKPERIQFLITELQKHLGPTCNE